MEPFGSEWGSAWVPKGRPSGLNIFNDLAATRPAVCDIGCDKRQESHRKPGETLGSLIRCSEAPFTGRLTCAAEPT
jgi:hypothetical protein